MPTINEVWEQAQEINANLVIVHNDLTGLQTAVDGRLDNAIGQLQQVNTRLQDLRAVVASGLASLSAGIAGLQQRQDVTNNLLLLHAHQFETMISRGRGACGSNWRNGEATWKRHLRRSNGWRRRGEDL